MSRKTACAVLILPLQVVSGLTYAMNKNLLFLTGVVVAHTSELSITEIEKMDSSSRMFKVSNVTCIKGTLKRGALVHLAARNDEAECITVVDADIK